jgi:predicted anti-sigma-YlaC factor YlaD
MSNEERNIKVSKTINSAEGCCSDEWGILVSAHIDCEIPPDKAVDVEEHLLECPKCAEFATSLRQIKGVTSEMKLADLPDASWKVYKKGIYNRLERGVGWIFASIGAVILIAFGFYVLFEKFFADPEISILIKIGVASLGIGIIILLISVCREALFRYKGDRYKEVEI